MLRKGRERGEIKETGIMPGTGQGSSSPQQDRELRWELHFYVLEDKKMWHSHSYLGTNTS